MQRMQKYWVGLSINNIFQSESQKGPHFSIISSLVILCILGNVGLIPGVSRLIEPKTLFALRHYWYHTVSIVNYLRR